MSKNTRKLQSQADIVIRIPLETSTGNTASGLDLASLSTVLDSPSGVPLSPGIDYSEASFSEINNSGVYRCRFYSDATALAFTEINQDTPYHLVLDSTVAGIKPKGVDVCITDAYSWELARAADVAGDVWSYGSRSLTNTIGLTQVDVAGFDAGFLINQAAFINIDLVNVDNDPISGRTFPGDLDIGLWKAGVAQDTSNITVQETDEGVYRTTIDGTYIDTPAIDYLLVVKDTSNIAFTRKVEFTAFDVLGASGPSSVDINIIDSNTTLPIPDTQVFVKNEDKSLTLSRGTTDAQGTYSLGLTDGTYNLLMQKAFVDFPAENLLVVAGDTTATYEGTSFIATSPGTPDTCVVYGWVIGIDGNPAKNAEVKATETEASRYNGVYKLGNLQKSVLTDSNGYWELELIQSSKLTPSGIKYRVDVTYPGLSYSKDILVPDLATAEFSTL